MMDMNIEFIQTKGYMILTQSVTAVPLYYIN